MLGAVEVVLVNASVLALPPSQRAGAIVYDGTDDLTLWRPPGVDRDLLYAFGDTLQSVLDRERAELPEGKLEIGSAVRLHPGKLRCDYVIWVAGRPPHGEEEPAPAPALSTLPALVRGALELASRHDTPRVAFGPLGACKGAADTAERMAAMVRAAQRFAEEQLARGAASLIEEVLVCAPSAAEVAKAKRLTAQLARHAAPESLRMPAVSSQRPGVPRTSGPPRASGAPRSSGTPRSSSSAPGRRGKPKLDPAQLAFAQTHAAPYDRTHSYQIADWLRHPSFGAGQVLSVLVQEKMIEVLFGDGQERKLIHSRA
jgi:O-acetyl-ADP-ribose deacetylase (regulator of RNase III)